MNKKPRMSVGAVLVGVTCGLVVGQLAFEWIKDREARRKLDEAQSNLDGCNRVYQEQVKRFRKEYEASAQYREWCAIIASIQSDIAAENSK